MPAPRLYGRQPGQRTPLLNDLALLRPPQVDASAFPIIKITVEIIYIFSNRSINYPYISDYIQISFWRLYCFKWS
jgi:hypothetical protein